MMQKVRDWTGAVRHGYRLSRFAAKQILGERGRCTEEAWSTNIRVSGLNVRQRMLNQGGYDNISKQRARVKTITRKQDAGDGGGGRLVPGGWGKRGERCSLQSRCGYSFLFLSFLFFASSVFFSQPLRSWPLLTCWHFCFCFPPLLCASRPFYRSTCSGGGTKQGRQTLCRFFFFEFESVRSREREGYRTGCKHCRPSSNSLLGSWAERLGFLHAEIGPCLRRANVGKMQDLYTYFLLTFGLSSSPVSCTFLSMS